MSAMEAVLRNFKLIPCPTGDSCNKANCPWKHLRDDKPPPPQPSQPQTQPPAGQLPGGAQDDEDGPRKRRKLSSEPAPAPAPRAAPPAEKPVSSQRPISPPPLKRKPSPGPNPPDRTPGPARPSSRSASGSGPAVTVPSPAPSRSSATPSAKAQSLPATPKSTPKGTPPRKPETLNPRHLKAAPAPHDFRYKAVKMLHEQYQRLNNEIVKDASEQEGKLVLSPQELIWLVLDEEQRIAADKPSLYTNLIKHRIMATKRMTPAEWKKERLAAVKKEEEARANESSFNTPTRKPVLGPPKVIETGLTPEQEVAFLAHLRTPIEGLAQYGYVSAPPSEDEIRKAREGEAASLGWEVCDRCTTRFQVFPGRRPEDGALTSGGKCVHHPGRPYFPERAVGDKDKPQRRYRCCNQVVGESVGCVSGNTHVFKTSSPARLAALIPFAETPPNPNVPKDRAVCFDCEMGYTVHGLELIRLTATSWPDGKELLDVLVRPVGEILDLNSRYSGVWPEDIVNAEPWSAKTATASSDSNSSNSSGGDITKDTIPSTSSSDGTGRRPRKRMKIVPSPVAARDLLFSLLGPDTPLIGHGLENDLNAVRIIHPTLIDTILLFPHRRGLPMRHGLKMLMETRLNRAIQVEDAEEDPTGHDSAEDARAAGELVRLKVMEKWKEMKAEGWKLAEGKFVPPGGEGGASARGLLTVELLEGR
ncbi:hypothetical protein VTJ83DRAFT_4011 [Remersonia thermophila]|uniref:Exonuclease domain-containing protein n=1 Tax=Remersonia thermophila TaxID=72144 RepID=A0ABR4DFN9_9PEZI